MPNLQLGGSEREKKLSGCLQLQVSDYLWQGRYYTRQLFEVGLYSCKIMKDLLEGVGGCFDSGIWVASVEGC